MPTTLTLHKVAWCNTFNHSTAINCDGYGSKAHLTSADGKAGKTLCGKEFPAVKGYPSTVGFCKRCCNAAYKMGFEKGFTKELGWVESSDE